MSSRLTALGKIALQTKVGIYCKNTQLKKQKNEEIGISGKITGK